jgi:hypothetical protein
MPTSVCRSRSDRTSSAFERPVRAIPEHLVICGVCGRRMTVRYHTRRGTLFPDYVCQYEGNRTATRICQNIPGAGIDTAVGELLMHQLSPLVRPNARPATWWCACTHRPNWGRFIRRRRS